MQKQLILELDYPPEQAETILKFIIDNLNTQFKIGKINATIKPK